MRIPHGAKQAELRRNLLWLVEQSKNTCFGISMRKEKRYISADAELNVRDFGAQKFQERVKSCSISRVELRLSKLQPLSCPMAHLYFAPPWTTLSSRHHCHARATQLTNEPSTLTRTWMWAPRCELWEAENAVHCLGTCDERRKGERERSIASDNEATV